MTETWDHMSIEPIHPPVSRRKVVAVQANQLSDVIQRFVEARGKGEEAPDMHVDLTVEAVEGPEANYAPRLEGTELGREHGLAFLEHEDSTGRYTVTTAFVAVLRGSSWIMPPFTCDYIEEDDRDKVFCALANEALDWLDEL